MKIAFIGLGNMGLPMAQNLLKAGYELTVYNRTKAKAEPLQSQGAKVADTPRQAAEGADVVISMLSDDAALEQVVFEEDGLMAGLREQGIHLSMSTIGVDMACKLKRAHNERNQTYLSAPVMGRPDAAQAAKLRILLAGPESARKQVLPIVEKLGQEVFEISEESEQGNVVKIAMNFLIASMLETLAEAQALVKKNGVDMYTFMSVVNGFFQSPIYKNYGAIMTDQKFEPAGFKMRLGLKDVNLALHAAQNVGADLPLGELIQRDFIHGIEEGRGEMDWTAIALNYLLE